MPTGPKVDRRTFLRRASSGLAVAGAAALLGAEAGCTDRPTSGTGHPSTTTSSSTTPRPTASTTTTSGPPDWSALAADLTGPLILPGVPAYDTARLVYNERYDSVAPAAIAQCADAGDIQRCIAFGRDHAVAVTARSGGHSYAGYSTSTGLVIDVSSLNQVQVAPDGQSATVGAGTKLIDLYSALGDAGVVVPGGSCPSVGIAGLALGGGIGVLARNFGLTCDHTMGVDLVTADSVVHTAGPTADPDLYWALRGGGGGNFGVATSFTFAVQPIPEITLFTLEWPWDSAGDVLGAWLAWISGTPDELWANCQLLTQGASGGPTPFKVKVTGVYAGSPTDCSAALQPLHSSVPGTPTYDFVGPEDFERAMLIEAGCEDVALAECRLTTQGGSLARDAFAAKSAYLDAGLPDAVISALISAVGQLDTVDPTFSGGLVLDAYGGAINQVAAADTAFVHRDAVACAQLTVNVPTGSATDVADAATWLAGAYGSLAPYARGAYQNYIDPTQVDWPSAYYGANLARLSQVKARYDPDDIFHFAQSIPLVDGVTV